MNLLPFTSAVATLVTNSANLVCINILLYLMYTSCYLNGYRNRFLSNNLFHNVNRPTAKLRLSYVSNIGTHFDDKSRNSLANTLSALEKKKIKTLAHDQYGGLIAPLANQTREVDTGPVDLGVSVATEYMKLERPTDDMSTNYAIARVPEDGDKLHLTIFWNNHKFRMERNREETIGVTLARLKKSLGKVEIARDVKTRRQNVTEELPDYSVSFLTNLFKTFDENSRCEDAIVNSSFISINDTLLKLFTNVPQLDKVKLLPKTMVDCPASLMVKDDADETYSQVSVEWLDGNGNLMGNNPVYVPTLADLGKSVRARVTNNLMKYDVAESNPSLVDVAPYCQWQLDRIHRFNTLPKSLVVSPLQDPRHDVRVVSFNILSPTYVSPTDPSSFFNYCPPEFLDTDYRNQLIGREIYYLNPQILCLQECSYRVYTEYLTYILGQRYHSWITIKGGNTPEGGAMFVNKNNFDPLETLGLCFKDVVRTERYRHVLDKICRNWLMFGENYFDKYHTIYQFGCYRIKATGKFMFLANTHLYFHPMANHIRLLQTYVFLSELEQFKANVSEKYGFDIFKDSYTLICGDFNCIPRESIHQLMADGYISYDHPDWKLGETFVYDKNILAREGYDRFKALMEQRHEAFDESKFLVVENHQGYSDSYTRQAIPFTNYCEAFNGTLDFIYHSNNVKPKRVMPGITAEEASEYIGLPSKLYPSDHLSIGADF